MDSKLTLLVNEELKEKFKELCKRESKVASEEIRGFMERYVKQLNNESIDLLEAISLKVEKEQELEQIKKVIREKVKGSGKMEGKEKVLILDKSILGQVASDGCQKRAIKSVTSKIVDKNQQYLRDNFKGIKVTEGDKIYDENFIAESLGISKYPPKNIVPLALYKTSGECAEISSMLKIINNGKGVCTNEKKDSNKLAVFYKGDTEKIEKTLASYKRKLNEIEENDDLDKDEEIIQKKDLECVFNGSSEQIKTKLDSINVDKGINYIYQMRYVVNNPLEMINKILGKKIDEYSKYKLIFSDFIPDFVKIIRPDEIGEYKKLKVLNEKFEIVESKPDKTKLQIKDVKMSSYRQSFCTEIAIYILTLNQFLIENKLCDYYEVVASGEILQENLGDIFESSKDKGDILNISLESVKENMMALFEKKLPKIISIINKGDRESYNNVIMENYCDTCDYYGNYYAGGVQYLDKNKDGIEVPKRVSKKDMKDGELKAYFEEENNDFCTIIEKNKKSINTISVLKTGEKKTLVENNYVKYNEIDENNFEAACGENRSLKANRNILIENIKLKKKDGTYIKYGEKTANCAKNESDMLNIYIDAKADTQKIGLCLGFGYEFITSSQFFSIKDKDGNTVIDKNGKEKEIFKWLSNPSLEGDMKNNSPNFNLYTIDKKNEEKSRMIELLINIDKVIRIFEEKIKKENKDNNSDRKLKIAIYYWNENVIDYLRELFINVIQYVIPQGDKIDREALKTVLNKRNIDDDDENDIKRVYQRLRGFFTIDRKDQVYVVANVIFCLQKAIEDIFVFNVDFNNTLFNVYKSLPSYDAIILKKFFEYQKYYKPYRDELHGGVFSKYKKVQQGNNTKEKDDIKDEIKEMLATRIQAMAVVKNNIPNSNVSIFPMLCDEIKTRGVDYKELKCGNLLYLFSKIQAFKDKSDKEQIHATDMYKKEVLGDSIKLKEEIFGELRHQILTDHELANSEEYKVFRVNKDSIFANFDDKDFLLTMYPKDKLDYIYRSFTNKKENEEFCIYIPDEALFKKISNNFFASKKNDETNDKLYSYKNILNGAISIAAFNRDETNPYVIIRLKELAQKLISYLEISRYNFNFKKDVILENCHKEYWLNKLGRCLCEIEENKEAINLIESLELPKIKDELISEELIQIDSTFLEKIEDDKKVAIAKMVNLPLSVLWGPPGTGKTYTIVKGILYYILRNMDKNIRIALIGGYDATYNIVQEIIYLLNNNNIDIETIKDEISIKRIVGEDRYNEEYNKIGSKWIEFIKTTDRKQNLLGTINLLDTDTKYRIITTTPHQIYKYFVKGTTTTKQDKTILLNELKSEGFDLIIIDEASQMDLSQFIPSVLRYNKNTKLLLAGDHNQLEPVQQIKLKKAEEKIFGSVLKYYMETYIHENKEYEVLMTALNTNRRSNEIIVEAIKAIIDYKDTYHAYIENSGRKIVFEDMYSRKYSEILDPDKIITIIKYDDGISGKVNNFEVKQISNMVKEIWNRRLSVKVNENDKKSYFGNGNLKAFFTKGIGVVVTHTAQRVMIQNELINIFKEEIQEYIEEKNIKKVEFDNIVKGCVDTVEKYQGQEREIIIGSFVVGESEIINSEAEFLYNPNRLNVMLSRARAKFILFVTNEMINNIPTEYELLEDQSSLLKLLNFANKSEILKQDEWEKESLEIRYR